MKSKQQSNRQKKLKLDRETVRQISDALLPDVKSGLWTGGYDTYWEFRTGLCDPEGTIGGIKK